MMSTDEPPPIPPVIHADEEGWKTVKSKRRERRRLSPIPPSPPPARPDLKDKMWHPHKYDKAPPIKTGGTLRSSREFNMTPSKENYRDKKLDRKEERQRAARAEVHEQRRRKPPPPQPDRRQEVQRPQPQVVQPLPPLSEMR